MPALDRKYRGSNAAVLAIQVDNTLMNMDFINRVQSVNVNLRRKKANTMSIKLYDEDFSLLDAGVLALHKYITIYCGWSDEVVRHGPFRITGYEPVYNDKNAPYFTLKGKDISATTMSMAVRSRSWSGKTVREVMTSIADEYGLKLDARLESADDILFNIERGLTQAGETDAQFVQRLMYKIGYVWGVDGDELYVARPEHEFNKPTFLDYKIGRKNILSFTPKLKVFDPSGKKKSHSTAISAGVDLTNPVDALTGKDKSAFYNMVSFLPEFRDGQGRPGIFVPSGINGTGLDFENMQSIDNSGASVYLKGKNSDGGDLMSYDRSRNNVETSTPVQPVKQRRSRFPGSNGSTTDLTNVNNAIGDITNILNSGGDTNNKLERINNRLLQAANEIPAIDICRMDQGQATPDKRDDNKRHIGKKLRRSAVESADIVPVVPSWLWTAKDTVIVSGVHIICQGRYEVHEVSLGYDKDKGLSTTLKCKKRNAGKGKGGKGYYDKDNKNFEEKNDDDNNPRKKQTQKQPQTQFLPEGRDPKTGRPGIFRRIEE